MTRAQEGSTSTGSTAGGPQGSSWFRGRVAVVTGAARGLGRAYAAAFLREGASVAIADIDGERARLTAAALSGVGGETYAVEVDVASETSVEAMYREILRRLGRVDILVNNAAIVLDLERPFKPFWEIAPTEWARVMAVNAGGVYLCCKHAKPIMERLGGGRIVNVTTDALWQAPFGQLAYVASKGAVAAMTRALARELGGFNITVNALAPGLTWSESAEACVQLRDSRSEIVASRAIPQDQYPDDLVGTVLFLSGPNSSCITGQTIVVNSGAVMP